VLVLPEPDVPLVLPEVPEEVPEPELAGTELAN
jgi:hypothetical protein